MAPFHSRLFSYFFLRRRIAIAAIRSSFASVARQYGVRPGMVRYWYTKRMNPAYHHSKCSEFTAQMHDLPSCFIFIFVDSWGGCRLSAAQLHERQLIDYVLARIVEQHPTLRLADYAALLRRVHLNVSPTYVCRWFKQMGISHKRLRARHVSLSYAIVRSRWLDMLVVNACCRLLCRSTSSRQPIYGIMGTIWCKFLRFHRSELNSWTNVACNIAVRCHNVPVVNKLLELIPRRISHSVSVSV